VEGGEFNTFAGRSDVAAGAAQRIFASSRDMMQGMRTLPLLWLVALAQFPVVDDGDFPADVQKSALAATVRVLNKERNVNGSGVVVGADDKGVYVLTAGHLIEKGEHLVIEVFTATSYPKPSEVIEEVELVAKSDSLRDLVLVKLPPSKTPMAKLSLPAAETAAPKTPFKGLVVGCSGKNPPAVRVEQVIAARRARREKGQEPVLFWEVEGKQAAGQSGGPLVDGSGRVAGICSGNNKELGYFCHFEEIQAFLKEHQFQWLFEDNKKKKE
jgi:S1-C subfamily serine protease